jgi:hypothetical protein
MPTPPEPSYVLFCCPLAFLSSGKSSSCGAAPFGAPTIEKSGDFSPK